MLGNCLNSEKQRYNEQMKNKNQETLNFIWGKNRKKKGKIHNDKNVMHDWNEKKWRYKTKHRIIAPRKYSKKEKIDLNLSKITTMSFL